MNNEYIGKTPASLDLLGGGSASRSIAAPVLRFLLNFILTIYAKKKSFL